MPDVYSREECIEALQATAGELGRPPRRQEFITEFEGPSHSPLRRHFGTWNEALQAAGLQTYEYSEAELAAIIREVDDRVDGLLTASAYAYASDDNHPHWKTFAERAESFAAFWDDVLKSE